MSETFDDPHSPVPPGPVVHPFIAVWSRPGPTIKEIATTNPMRSFFPLASLWGASTSLGKVVQRGFPAETLNEPAFSSPWSIVGLNLIFGAAFGILILWLGSFLFCGLGRLVGGRATVRQVRTALAWSSVPHLPILVVAVVVILVGGTAVIAQPTDHPLRLIFLLISAFFGLYSLIVSIVGMSAVMEFGKLQAAAVLFLGTVLIVVAVLAPIVGIALLVRG